MRQTSSRGAVPLSLLALATAAVLTACGGGRGGGGGGVSFPPRPGKPSAPGAARATSLMARHASSGMWKASRTCLARQ